MPTQTIRDSEPAAVQILESLAEKNDFFVAGQVDNEGIKELSFDITTEQLKLSFLTKIFGHHTWRYRIVSNHAGNAMAEELSRLTGIQITQAILPYYKNGEPNVDIRGHVDGKEFIIIAPRCRSFCDDPILEQKFYSPANNYEQMRMILKAIKLAGNRTPTSILVMPYLSNSKKDHIEDHGDLPIQTMGEDLDQYEHIRVILTAFVHCETAITHAIRACRVDNTTLVAPYARVLERLVLLEKLKIKKVCVAAIDDQGLKKVKPIATAVGWPFFMDHKGRPKGVHDKAESYGGIGNVRGMTVLMCDDLIQSLSTFGKGIKAFQEKGAKDVIMVIGSPDFTFNTTEKAHAVDLILQNDFIRRIVMFDTTPLAALLINRAKEMGKTDKVIVVKFATLLAHYIWRKILRMSSRDLRGEKPKCSLLTQP